MNSNSRGSGFRGSPVSKHTVHINSCKQMHLTSNKIFYFLKNICELPCLVPNALCLFIFCLLLSCSMLPSGLAGAWDSPWQLKRPSSASPHTTISMCWTKTAMSPVWRLDQRHTSGRTMRGWCGALPAEESLAGRRDPCLGGWEASLALAASFGAASWVLTSLLTSQQGTVCPRAHGDSSPTPLLHSGQPCVPGRPELGAI